MGVVVSDVLDENFLDTIWTVGQWVFKFLLAFHSPKFPLEVNGLVDVTDRVKWVRSRGAGDAENWQNWHIKVRGLAVL